MRELKPILDGGEPEAITLVPVQLTTELQSSSAPESNNSAEKFRLPLNEDFRSFLCEHFGLVLAAEKNAQASESEETVSESVATVTADSESEPDAQDASVEKRDVDEDVVAGATAAAQAPESAKPAFEEPKVVLSPREIQDRVRAGKSVDELVEFSGMQRRKIEAFAYPVLAERARIAELGKQSRARRQEGPTKLTLWEILATAFAARGLELADATWDAYRNNVGQWIVSVTWNAGHTTNTAEWSYQAEGSNAVSIARNNLAAELVDPDWARRHRDLAPAADEDSDTQNNDMRNQASTMPPAWQNNQGGNQRRGNSGVDGESATPQGHALNVSDEADELDDDEAAFLQHPEHAHQSKRRKKTVMPSWEDVLFGVRPNDRNKQ